MAIAANPRDNHKIIVVLEALLLAILLFLAVLILQEDAATEAAVPSFASDVILGVPLKYWAAAPAALFIGSCSHAESFQCSLSVAF